MFYSLKQNANQGLNSKSGAEGKIIQTKYFYLDFYGEQMQSNVTAERAEWWRVEDRFNKHKQGSVAYPSKSRSAAAL